MSNDFDNEFNEDFVTLVPKRRKYVYKTYYVIT